jgi:hypothetical protein
LDIIDVLAIIDDAKTPNSTKASSEFRKQMEKKHQNERKNKQNDSTNIASHTL